MNKAYKALAFQVLIGLAIFSHYVEAVETITITGKKIHRPGGGNWSEAVGQSGSDGAPDSERGAPEEGKGAGGAGSSSPAKEKPEIIEVVCDSTCQEKFKKEIERLEKELADILAKLSQDDQEFINSNNRDPATGRVDKDEQCEIDALVTKRDHYSNIDNLHKVTAVGCLLLVKVYGKKIAAACEAAAIWAAEDAKRKVDFDFEIEKYKCD